MCPPFRENGLATASKLSRRVQGFSPPRYAGSRVIAFPARRILSAAAKDLVAGEPCRYVAAAVRGTLEAEGLAANQGNRFRFDLPKVPG